jgi:hypothetical protein
MSCRTTGGVLLLDSGLEYELARELDRDRDVTWIVSQPAQIIFPDGTKHVPDILAEHADGHVVIWDARPVARRDDCFSLVAALTKDACDDLGWSYELYGGGENARSLNLAWLTCFRRPPRWPHHAAQMLILEEAAAPTTVSALMKLDSGDGHAIALMWHMMWSGELIVDPDAPITPSSPVCRRVDVDA